jgi:uncharacterized heparinase superfamily protein
MRAQQVLHRARRLLPFRVLAAGLSGSSPAPGWLPLASGLGVDSAPMFGPAVPPHVGRMFWAGEVSREAGREAFWSDDADGLLFLFHLHGFSDLARYAAGPSSPEGDAFWLEVVGDWLTQCGKPTAPGWHPYPLSGRILAWCAALSRGDGWFDQIREQMLTSTWLQLRFLARWVERDIGGNHVLRNAAALVIGGICVDHAETRDRGLSLLEAELAAQVLDDGGHEERSTSYQRRILDDLSDVAVVIRRSGGGTPAWLERARGEMTTWLQAVAGPGGQLSPLNDGWDGPAIDVPNHRSSLQDLAGSGYIVLREGHAQAVIDVGPLAPAHLPAHAHADALSFVFWADGRPVIIDPGSGAYAGAERNRFRATRAHNTVEVDGRDQCDFWGPFRAAFMPTVRRSEPLWQQGALLLRAEHDGYRRLDDPVVHERTFVWLGSEGLLALDKLIAETSHSVLARLHFAEDLADPLGELLPGGLRILALGPELGEPRAIPGDRGPYLGARTPITIVERAGRVSPGARFGWAITPPDVAVHLQPRGVEVAAPGRPTRFLPFS